MGVGAGTSYMTGGDPWIGAALGGLSFYANHMLHGDGGGDGNGDGNGEKKPAINKEQVQKGALGVYGGGAQALAGIGEIFIPGGEGVGMVAVINGIGRIGFGLANVVVGLTGKNIYVPSGYAEAIDLASGGKGYIGRATDVRLSTVGTPGGVIKTLTYGYRATIIMGDMFRTPVMNYSTYQYSTVDNTRIAPAYHR